MVSLGVLALDMIPLDSSCVLNFARMLPAKSTRGAESVEVLASRAVARGGASVGNSVIFSVALAPLSPPSPAEFDREEVESDSDSSIASRSCLAFAISIKDCVCDNIGGNQKGFGSV